MFNDEKPKYVYADYYYSATITNKGNLYTWGYNSDGNLGTGDREPRENPEHIIFPNEEKVVFLSAKTRSVMAITDKGNLYAWGNNNHNQLGLNNTISMQLTPKLIELPNNEKAKYVSTGYSTFVITEEENLYSWGYNYYGQLGVGDKIDKKTPKLVTLPNNEKAIAVSTMEFFSLILTNKGNVYSCGINNYGQLGLGDYSNQTTPKLITLPYEEKAIKINTGEDCSMILTDKGNLYSCGRSKLGQLGLGNCNDREPNIKKIRSNNICFFTGYNNSVSINNLGEFFWWGDNFSGKLIDLDTEYVSSPLTTKFP